jgi:predicted nucleotidyltransferase
MDVALSTQFPRHILTPLRCLAQKNNVCAVYIFGSHARGDADAGSDVDIALLFAGEPDPFVTAALEDEIRASLRPVSCDVVTFNRLRLVLQFRIIREGIVVFCTDDDYRTDVEDSMVRKYLDLRPFVRRSDDELLEIFRKNGRTTVDWTRITGGLRTIRVSVKHLRPGPVEHEKLPSGSG